MSRLFYRVFALFCVVIICSVGLTSASFWLVQNNIDESKKIDEAHKKSELLGNALAIFYLDGEDGVTSLLQTWQQRKVPYKLYVINEDNKDLLGRPIRKQAIKTAKERALNQPVYPYARIAYNDFGESYLFFIVNPTQAEPPPPDVQKRWFATIIFIIAGLVMAYFLARYLEKPISVLHNGFERLADGHLDTRIKPNMGKRKDELALLANDFDNMANKLQTLVESQQHLLHHVSHEMRSPLARLQAIVDLARQQSTEQREKNLGRIEAELIRMDTLIGELLTLARLETDSAHIQLEELNINKLFEQLLDDCHELAQKNNQTISLEQPTEPILFQGNEALLYRAFDNIVRNACLYSGQNGIVSIHLTQKNQNIIIQIQDNGPGVDEAEIAHLFEPFYRADATQHIKGTGLGLAITQQIIERHHGTIRAQNVSPHGLMMIITLVN
ncbi:ATP-binding protein [Neisseria sp. Ec49-e6-T10]|uniref:sensor histidine kinase n=1 Tax=Neisseria sp. Ec49-e6-T10 TaxID=3140744 RepID=UPI003EBD2AEB